jgi:EAL domain-containing protein (putative c-di-GMP-specific phosphodiesterase class I)
VTSVLILDDRAADRELLATVLGDAGYTVLEAATAFGQQTIAEGVENAETLALLRDYGVDYAQGFHLGRPAPLPATRRS